MAPKKSATKTSKTSKAQASSRGKTSKTSKAQVSARGKKKAAAPAPRGFSFSSLPDVLLTGIFDYSGLPEVAACAAASVELRDDLKRLSPALERRLVLRRFPILATIRADAAEEPSPRELFLSQNLLFAPRPVYGPLSRSINDYVFSVELELQISRQSGQEVVVSHESIFVGTGVLNGDPGVTIQFDIPEGVFDRNFDWDSRDEDITEQRVLLRLMASKGYSRARLGQGFADEYIGVDPCIMFYNLGMGMWQHGQAQPSDWLTDVQTSNDVYCLPQVEANWEPKDEDESNASLLLVTFRWVDNFNNEDMTKDEVVQALERYATWTS